MEAAACTKPATGYTYARREPEKTALFQVLQQHLLTFEQEWTDKSDGRTLPSFVTRRCATLGPTRPATSPRALRARPSELHDFMGCGILARGFAHLCYLTQRGRPRAHRARPCRRQGQAQEHLKVYFLVRTFAPYIRDRNSLHQVQVPAPLDRPHQDRGCRQENSQGHASAVGCSSASPRAPSAPAHRPHRPQR